MLRGFEELLPGAADRIFGMAERQEAHRHSLESANLRGNLRSQLIGQVFSLLIGLAGMGCGTFLLYSGKSIAGFSAMFAPLTGLAGIFIYGRRKQEQERREKLSQIDRPN